MSPFPQNWPEDIVPVQRGGTASLTVKVHSIDMKATVASQVDAIEGALEAAYRLMQFASLLSDFEESVEEAVDK